MDKSVDPPTATKSPAEFTVHAEKTNTTSWAGRTVKYRVALNGYEKDMQSLFSIKKWAIVSRGTHKLLIEEKKWKQIPEAQRDTFLQQIEQERKTALKQAIPQAEEPIDSEFPEDAEKLKSIAGSTFPALARVAKESKNHSAKVEVNLHGTAYKIICQKKKNGAFEFLIIGGKLGQGGQSTVLKLVQMEIPYKLTEQAWAKEGVYYKPRQGDSQEQSFRATVEALMLALEANPQAVEVLREFQKLVKKDPRSPKVAKDREFLQKAIQGHPKEAELAKKLEFLADCGPMIEMMKEERRQGIDRGAQMGLLLKERNTPHVMEYYGVRVKGGKTAGAMAEICRGGDARKLIPTSKPTPDHPLEPEEELQRLIVLTELTETLMSLQDTQIDPTTDQPTRPAICLCDLKTENVFLKIDKETGTPHAKVGDTAGGVKEGEPIKESSPLYTAPETKIGRPAQTVSDIYAFGLIAFEVLQEGIDPSSFNPDQFVKERLFSDHPVHQLIGRMVDKEPAKRPSLPEIKQVLEKRKEAVAKEVEKERKAKEEAIESEYLSFAPGPGEQQAQEAVGPSGEMPLERTETSSEIEDEYLASFKEEPLKESETQTEAKGTTDLKESATKAETAKTVKTEEEASGRTEFQAPAKPKQETSGIEASSSTEKVEKEKLAPTRMERFAKHEGKQIVVKELKAELERTSDPQKAEILRKKVEHLKKELGDNFVLQAGDVKIYGDEEGVVFGGKKTTIGTIIKNLPSDVTEKQKQKIIQAHKDNALWISPEQVKEIERNAQIYAKELLKELSLERKEKLKEKGSIREKKEERIELRKKAIATEKPSDSKKEYKRKSIIPADNEAKLSEEEHRKQRRGQEEEEKLIEKSDEKRRLDYKKRDQKRESRKEYDLKKDIRTQEAKKLGE